MILLDKLVATVLCKLRCWSWYNKDKGTSGLGSHFCACDTVVGGGESVSMVVCSSNGRECQPFLLVGVGEGALEHGG